MLTVCTIAYSSLQKCLRASNIFRAAECFLPEELLRLCLLCLFWDETGTFQNVLWVLKFLRNYVCGGAAWKTEPKMGHSIVRRIVTAGGKVWAQPLACGVPRNREASWLPGWGYSGFFLCGLKKSVSWWKSFQDFDIAESSSGHSRKKIVLNKWEILCWTWVSEGNQAVDSHTGHSHAYLVCWL